MVYHISVPQSAQSPIDPEFWDRLREALKAHMESNGLKQKELAEKLGIDPTTLNNFLNHQSKTLGGLAVALACTLIDLVCNGRKIGRIMEHGRASLGAGQLDEKLVLEFDAAFEVKRESKRPTIVVRKPAGSHDGLRLAIRRIG
jgi:transcriptional regulator with XRE-family HTH domain